MDNSPKSPKITVLMPVYNAATYVGEAIDSILNQTFTDFEFLIINDASTDSSRDIILSYSDPRIRLIDNDENLKIVKTLNRGIELARGEYIARMDSDDISLPNRLEEQVGYLEAHPDVCLCGSWVENFGSVHSISKLPTDPEEAKIMLLFECPVCHPAVTMRAKTLRQLKDLYRQEFLYAEDYDLWSRLSEKGQIINIPEVLLRYRVHSQQISQTKIKIQRQVALEVKRYALESFGIEPTEQELNTHLAITTYRSGTTTSLPQTVNWLVRLQKHNNTNHIFAPEVFDRVLRHYAEKWLIYSSTSRLASFISYVHSPLMRQQQSLGYNALLAVNMLGRIPVGVFIWTSSLPRRLKEWLSDPYQAILLRRDIVVDKIKSKSNRQYSLQRTIPANPKIGIAVLALNRPEYLRICLDSLFTTKLYDYDVTFLIQDDGSTDPEVCKIINREYDPKYKIIRQFNDKCHGSWGGAFNSAMKTLLKLDRFDIIGSCDSDAYFHPQWLDKTIEIARWAKQNHTANCLGPFSSFNSSDTQLHRIMGKFSSPYGNYVVKQRMGAVNYLYLTEDFLKLGYFVESKDDETLMSENFNRLRVRNFCTDISYVEHIGHYSTLDQWRPVAVEKTAYGLNLAPGEWLNKLKKYSLQDLRLHPFQPATPDKITKLLSSIRFHVGLLLGVTQTRVNNKLSALAKDPKVEIELRPTTNPTPSQLKLDIVIAAIDKDLEILPHVIASARKNLLHPIGNIFIICPQSPKMTKFGIDHDCVIVNENTLLPMKKDDLNYVIYGENRNGWLFQQLLKLAASTLSEEENYLILDADTVLVRPQVFEKNGKIIFDASDEYSRPYLDVYQKLTGNNDLLPISCVSHHSLINQAVLKELKQLIEKRSGLPWYKGIIEYTDYTVASGFSEYETYANFYFHNHKEKMILEYWKNLSLARGQFAKIDQLINKYHNKYKTISFHHYK